MKEVSGSKKVWSESAEKKFRNPRPLSTRENLLPDDPAITKSDGPSQNPQLKYPAVILNGRQALRGREGIAVLSHAQIDRLFSRARSFRNTCILCLARSVFADRRHHDRPQRPPAVHELLCRRTCHPFQSLFRSRRKTPQNSGRAGGRKVFSPRLMMISGAESNMFQDNPNLRGTPATDMEFRSRIPGARVP